MNISSVTEAPHQVPAAPVPPAAPAGKVQEEAATQAVAPVSKPVAPASAPPPPLPDTGFDQEVLVGIDEATNRKVYDFVDPESGDSVVQIPAEAILNLIAKILQQLEAEGLR